MVIILSCFLILCVQRSINRNSSLGLFCKKGVFKILTKFTEKYLCLNLVFKKVSGQRLGTLFKERLRHRCFPVNFAKFLRTHFLLSNSGGSFLITFKQTK